MKNVIVFNNRSLHLYDFKELKSAHDLRISAVVFDKSFQKLSTNIKEALDDIYVLPDTLSPYESLESFPKEALDSIVKNEVKKFPNTWIVAADELNNLALSLLRKKYNLPGTPHSIILSFRDKVTQKEILNSEKVRVPKFMALHKQSHKSQMEIHYKNLSHFLGLPFILKPLNLFGTIGVEKIESYNQFCNYFTKFPDFSNLIAEGFINSHLYHCDFIIQDNRYVFAEVSEYLRNGLSFLSGYNHGSLLLTHTHPLRLPIIDFCKKANAILGLKSGCGHFEVFVTKNQEIIFLEAAARPAGSLVPLVFTKTFQKNYMNAALLAEIEEDPGNFKDPLEYYFWVCFPKRSGIIKELKSPPLKSDYKTEWYVKSGDTLMRPSLSLVERAGILLAHNKNYDILKTDFNSIRRFEAFTLK